MLSSPVIGVENPRITADEARAALTARIRAEQDQDAHPVIVYDLDATLFDNRPRVMQIIADLLLHEEAAEFSVEVRRAAGSVTPRKMKYRLTDTLKAHGIEDPDVLKWFEDGWFKRFFTNEYVQLDLPTPGAVEFVNQMHDIGVRTVYLTGRDTPGMREGTHAALVQYKFPEPDGQRCILITKPTFEQPDMEYKMEVVEELKKLGTVIGVFDNEPKPMNVLTEAFPEAEHFYLDTMHSPDVEPLLPGIRVLPDFT